MTQHAGRFTIWVDDAYLIFDYGHGCWSVSWWPYPHPTDPCGRCGHRRASHVPGRALRYLAVGAAIAVEACWRFVEMPAAGVMSIPIVDRLAEGGL